MQINIDVTVTPERITVNDMQKSGSWIVTKTNSHAQWEGRFEGITQLGKLCVLVVQALDTLYLQILWSMCLHFQQMIPEKSGILKIDATNT